VIIDDELRTVRKFVWTWTRRCDDITPTKFQGNECDPAKGGGSGVGDSVLFSAILYYSGEDWAGESVRKSQGADGRMWRAPQRVNKDSEPTFSRDHLLGAMLYMVTLKKRGHSDIAIEFGRNLWEWVAEKRRKEIQKALDEVSSVSTLRDLIRNPRKTLDTILGGAVPSRYRVCDGPDDYCSISLVPYGHWGRLMLEVWKYVGVPTNISKSMKRKIPIPFVPDLSFSLDFDLGEYSAINYDLIFDQNNLADAIGGSSFHNHLSVVTAIVLREIGKSTAKSEETVKAISQSNSNPFFLWADGQLDEAKQKVIELCPRSQPAERTQWAWERDYDQKAWEESFGWDFIAVINLLLGDTEFVAP
jgi:hypothetical protein